MEVFLGTIIAWPLSWAPMGWAICDGRTIPVQQNQALFSLLGTTYGGNGTTTFGLPDLRGRFPLGMCNGVSGRANHALGSVGGNELVTLNPTQVPLVQHTHTITNTVSVTDTTASVNMDIKIPVNTDAYDAAKVTNTPGNTCTFGRGKAGSFTTNIYTTSDPTPGANLKPFTAQGNVTVPAPTITVNSNCAAASQPAAASVNIMPPYQTINYIIAINGYYPTRD